MSEAGRKMSKIWLGPVGRISRGHVLDCAKAPLERKLRELDSRLYVEWNPRKLKGHGLWEVRIRPHHKRVKEVVEFGGISYQVLDYVENNFENHVLDCAFLNYDIVCRLKAMDTWSVSQDTDTFAREMDYRANKVKEKTEENAKSERRYELKQQKSMIRDLMDYTLSGNDPADIARYWPK